VGPGKATVDCVQMALLSTAERAPGGFDAGGQIRDGALVVLSLDTSLVAPLLARAGRLGWRAAHLADPPGVAELRGLRANMVVVDRDRLGPAWETTLGALASACDQAALVVSAGQSSVAERVRGLRLGADDWVTKPCHPEEVLVRCEAALRRVRFQGELVGHLVAGGLEIRVDRYDAFAGGRAAGLTRREFELLLALARADGAVVERDAVYAQVWGYAMAHGDRSVDVFVRKLRTKLATVSPDWRYVHTQFGVGYRFAAVRKEA
jgi:DNA-binding response OmpR family regulator